jgi:hypothetical protein
MSIRSQQRRRTLIALPAILGLLCPLADSGVAKTWSVQSDAKAGTVQIELHGRPFITYVFRDAEIPRPYFANAFAPNGVKITRNHPPEADDPQDHDKMHPGVWLAFGDLSGADSWRLKAPVEHVRFVNSPTSDHDKLSFTVENRYLPENGQREICREECRYSLHALPQGVLVSWASNFRSSDGSFYFGDQEELGLGVRLAKPIAVKTGAGGRILNSNGQKNENGAWGKQAAWCDYSGVIDGQFVGITIMPHPKNFRQSWCHARDTGFMAMNPFGRNAFTGGEASKIVVEAGQNLRLRYAVLFHWNQRPDEFDPAAAYEEHLRLIGD